MADYVMRRINLRECLPGERVLTDWSRVLRDGTFERDGSMAEVGEVVRSAGRDIRVWLHEADSPLVQDILLWGGTWCWKAMSSG